ncbi:MAG: hypothetical protein R3344_11925, partial [Acidobacteriota bacterium]|nr:hypothetical protein [Acidobacteriota bacterium]
MRSPIRWILLGVAVSALIVGGAPAQERDDELDVDALILRVDPTNDDWGAESLQAIAAAQLKTLADAMARGTVTAGSLEGVAARDARATRLRPKKMSLHRVAGRLEASRLTDPIPSRLSMSLPGALLELVGPFDGPGGPEIGFKIVEVETITDSSFATTVRYEATGRRGTSVLQQTAYWRIEWARQPDDRPPLVASVRVHSHDEVSP